MTEHNDDDLKLEVLFQEARAQPLAVPEALNARVLAQGLSVQPHTPRPRRVWQMWSSVSGLVTATVVGVWMGVSPPDSLPDFADTLFLADWDIGDELSEEPFVTGFGWDFEEG